MQTPAFASGQEAGTYLGMCTLLRHLAAARPLEALFKIDCGDNANVLMRMAMFYNIFGNYGSACTVLAAALAQRQRYVLAAPRTPVALRLLVVLKPGFALDNTPVEFLLEDSDVTCELLYVTDAAPLPARLPAHDVLFVAIGQFLQHRPYFDRIAPLLRQCSGPVLNGPAAAFGCERDRVSALLQGIDGLVVPATRRMDRAALATLGTGGTGAPVAFPVIARPLLSQAGHGLELLAGPEAVGAYLARRPEAVFYVAPFVDYASADGLYRKCRLLLLRGRPFVCHLAIGDHWMVHYLTAGMQHSAAKRDEEASFMAASEHDFCQRHGPALWQLAARLELDYVVVDCAETADGQLLFFEADNISLIHAMDSADLFPYKQVQMGKVFQAFRALLAECHHAALPAPATMPT